MLPVSLRADVTAYVLQKTARWTARYGRTLQLDGTELPAPRRVRVPTRHGSVGCLVYRPARPTTPLPCYVHLHGGAFMLRHPVMDDFLGRFVATRCEATVVLPDFAAAPQVRYPVAHEQTHDVAAWIATTGTEVGVDGRRVAVGGFSSGGNLAAATALRARDEGSFAPVLQVLGVPALDVAEDVSRKTSPLLNPTVTPELLTLVRSTYFRDATRRVEPYASPLRAPDLTGVADALVLTAEYDVLRREGDAYAARLSESGVDVLHHVVGGRDHYFLDGNDPARAHATLRVVTDRLRAAFA
ncbi:MAG: alpha/beta hydrolase fold domain-containing protein [Nocardioidaceae bacterium]|nr:alpha/beta hydrolase fold domain-containing protein [Nocardioidaceae bacterium]NUS52785.1 alpha/beta hydrolase fold domain-containing protein [Nocardioidaceae bacterium]